jgi:hypothetical protein
MVAFEKAVSGVGPLKIIPGMRNGC